MSVAEIAPRGESFDRTPPHDVAAEQCVLGGMLLSKDAISDVMETIRPDDHYRPAHQIVHEAILELYGRGEPADPVTVSDLLSKRGELARIGGPTYLHTLIASVPPRPTPATTPGSSASAPSCAAWSRSAPASCSSATPATGKPMSWWTGPRPRSTG